MAQRETRLLWEYLKETYPDDTWVANVELGPLPADVVLMRGTRGAATRLRPFRRRVDATHWTPDVFELIEAKIRDPMPGLGALMVYEGLAKHTPDLVGYTGQPIRKVLLVPFALDWVKTAAEELDVVVVEFWREWIADYFREIQNYFTKDYRTARDDLKQRRQLLGVGDIPTPLEG